MGGEAPEAAVAHAALLASAARATAVRDSGRFGVQAGEVSVDWAGLRAHLARAAAEMAPDSSQARFEGMGMEVVRATARFAAPDTVAAAGREWRFRRCLLAAGAVPVVPSLQGLEAIPYFTAETIHELEEPPEHLVVLGGSAFGLEMAQAHARLGCRVTVVEPGRIAPDADAELADGLARVLRREGVSLLEGHTAVQAERAGDGLTLVLSDGRRVEGSHLLLALGRAPRLAGLDLVVGNVVASGQGLSVNAALRSTSNRRVWAAGGILGRAAYAASHDVALIARNMLFRLSAARSGNALPRAVRTEPALVQVGPSAAEAGEAGQEIQLLRWPLAENARAVAEGIGEGLVKLVADRRGRLLGAGILAPGAVELAGLLGLAIGKPLSALAGLALPDPSFAAAVTRAAAEFQAPLLSSPAVRKVAGIAKRLP
jgi:pyruvate/2-oxoglutarate dehydrogenase complex dihydrolipoamide dehydrogenase (E3) component